MLTTSYSVKDACDKQAYIVSETVCQDNSIAGLVAPVGVADDRFLVALYEMTQEQAAFHGGQQQDREDAAHDAYAALVRSLRNPESSLSRHAAVMADADWRRYLKGAVRQQVQNSFRDLWRNSGRNVPFEETTSIGAEDGAAAHTANGEQIARVRCEATLRQDRSRDLIVDAIRASWSAGRPIHLLPDAHHDLLVEVLQEAGLKALCKDICRARAAAQPQSLRSRQRQNLRSKQALRDAIEKSVEIG